MLKIAPQISRNGEQIKRLLIKPCPPTPPPDSSVLIKSLTLLCKTGIVMSTCDNSQFSETDQVEYLYPENEGEYEIYHEGVQYDFVFEKEIVTKNGTPINVLFVEQLSKIETTKDGIFINQDTKGVTAKGKVVAAPVNSIYEVDKIVEYRKNEKIKDFYPQIEYGGKRCEVLQMVDVFKYRGEVSAERIIVKIDRKAQYRKQTKKGDIYIPPMYRYMLFNLQYGEVVEIGKEAAKWYPLLKVGDTAILHHHVESQIYRTLSVDNDYEYRICNTYDPMSREIMGVLKYDKLYGWDIIPFGKQIFLSPDIIPFDETYNPKMDANKGIGGKEMPFSNYVSMIEARQIRANQDYNLNFQQLNHEGRSLKDDNAADVKRSYEIISAIQELQMKKQLIDSVIKRNSLVIAKQVSPELKGVKVIIPYKELYPINLMGKDYLIGHENFIVAHLNN